MTSYMQPPPRYQLILASQSPRRKHLLADAGIFADHVIAADIDETPRKGEKSLDYVNRIALEKNKEIKKKKSEIVLSADTAVSLGRRILLKPSNIYLFKSFINLIKYDALFFSV